MTKTIAILGTGMAGLGAGHRLKDEPVELCFFDKNSNYGGVTTSMQLPSGFTFDYGPHVSFTKDERIQKLFADNVDGQFETIQYYLNNYWQGHWVTHPVQNNMFGLPTELVTKVICEFAELSREERPSPANYEEWLLGSYGPTFSQTFPMVYTEKYHTTPAANMSTEWIGPRMYRPSLSEVVRGSLTSVTPNIHYVTHFRYPSRGGFMSFIHRFVQHPKCRFNHRLVRLNPKDQTLLFANGVTVPYDGVVSSIPLPDLIPLIEGAPRDVIEAAGKLACTTCILVNVGVARPDVSGVHISYFYDPDIIFTRVSFPYKMSPNNAPQGTSSIQTEIYGSSKYKPLDGDPSSYIDKTIKDLIRCGLIGEGDEILEKFAMRLDYANIIFDLDRKPSLDVVHGYLDSIGVAYCGRYGDWGYIWTDESFKSGERAAETALANLAPQRASAYR